jgi:hypothetical protein
MKLAENNLRLLIRSILREEAEKPDQDSVNKADFYQKLPSKKQGDLRKAVDKFVKAQVPTLVDVAKNTSGKSGEKSSEALSSFLENPRLKVPPMKLGNLKLSGELGMGSNLSVPKVKAVVEKGKLKGFTFSGELGPGLEIKNVFVQTPEIPVGENMAAQLGTGLTQDMASAKAGLNYKIPGGSIGVTGAGNINLNSSESDYELGISLTKRF